MPEIKALVGATHPSTWIPASSVRPKIDLLYEPRRLSAVALSRRLSISSPLYQRLISAILDSLIPPGTQLVLSPSEARDSFRRVLDWFWYNGPAALLPNARDLATSLFIDGELLIKPRVNPHDGRVTLTNLDPEIIEDVIAGEGLGAVHAIKTRDKEPLKVIRRNAEGQLEGDVFYFRVLPAGLTTGYRGVPLLVAQLDEVASLTEFFYSRVTKLARFSSFYWDVTLEGASQDMVKDFLTSPDSTPPEAGEVFAHNERVEWELVSARISDLSREFNFVVNFLAGAAGLTPEFLGHTPGRDITTESLFAATMHLNALRADLFENFSTLVSFQLEKAVEKDGSLKRVPEFNIIAKQIGTRTLQRAAQAFFRYTDGLTRAVQEQLITKEEATKVVRLLLVQLGLLSEVDLPEGFGRLNEAVEGSTELVQVIRKTKNKNEIVLYSSDSTRVLGRFPFGPGKEYSNEEKARAAARNREREIDWFKKQRLTAAVTKTVGGVGYPPGDFLVVEDIQKSTTWHLQVKRHGKPDHGLMGGAWAALHKGHRGNKYQGPDKGKALAKLKALYKAEGMSTPDVD